MTKIERLQAVLAGRQVDRPPFSIWYHFGTQHASADRTAQSHIEFFEAYDLDFLKAMNDYDYPMPEGMEIIATPEDLKHLGHFNINRGPMGEQLKAIGLMAKALKGKAFLLDTVFDAWSVLWRNLTKEAISRLMKDHPQAVENALKVINNILIQYALASLEKGANGIFFSVRAAAEAVTLEQYNQFMRPFNLAFLNAIRGQGEFHVLHAHGEKLYFDQLLDYPVDALSWADLNGGPSIEDARRKASFTLMGGLDHIKFPFLSVKVIRDQVKAAISRAGNTKFILAPGCAVPTFCFPAIIQAARDAARV